MVSGSSARQVSEVSPFAGLAAAAGPEAEGVGPHPMAAIGLTFRPRTMRPLAS
jgi:hypothetical protein